MRLDHRRLETTDNHPHPFFGIHQRNWFDGMAPKGPISNDSTWPFQTHCQARPVVCKVISSDVTDS